MKKSNLWLYIFTTFICSFSAINICQSQNFEIQMPNTYIDTDINIENRSDIFFETNWNDWFWLLFLWWQDSVIDHRKSPITLTISGNSIECKKQLRWYYSTNYWNFHPLPIDSETKISGSNVKFITWWLFYDCHNESTIYTWVYWYVKRGIWDLWNTQEIRAWVNEDHNWFKNQSPLQLVFSEWKRNRALSGNAQDSLAQTSRFVAHMPVYELVQIWIPDEYFDNTAIFSENVNEIYFNDAWNNWFWLFFLWTGIDWDYEIQVSWWNTLKCNTQLNWYYTISFTDFGMFPLDQSTLNITANYSGTKWVSLTWWLYYNCNLQSTTYTWVYWYIKWTYWLNSWNSHEIWAWIDSRWNRLNKSPLELIYSENFRNTGRSLSGNFHSSLVKNSFVQNRFFGDMWLSTWNNILPVWTIDNHHFYIYHNDYIIKDIKIYLKSSTIWSTGIVILTWFDSTWQFVTWFQKEVSLSNARSLYNFYWYTYLDFPYEEDMRTWTISVTISNSWQNRSKSINFAIQPGEPKITINQNAECSTGIIITATASDNATLGYRINDTLNSSCDDGIFDYQYTGPITFIDDNYNWRYICFQATSIWWTSHAWHQITWIDNRGPIVTFDNQNVDECPNDNLIWYVSATDSCAWIWNNAYQFSEFFWNDTRIPNWYITITPTQIWRTWNITRQQIVTVQDIFWNTTIKTGTLTIKDILPTLGKQTDDIWIISWNYIYWNVINKLQVKEWSCWTGDLTTTLIWCSNGVATWKITNNILEITPYNSLQLVRWSCDISFTDNEWNIITWSVKFTVDTKSPIITINYDPADINSCSKWKTISATIDETGTIYIHTWTTPTCDDSITPFSQWNSISFNKESDIWTYVCFKAIDTIWNTSYSWSVMITWIDRTPPVFELDGNFEWDNNPTLYECEEWFANITGDYDTWCFQNSLTYWWQDWNTITRSKNYRYTNYETGTKIVTWFVTDAWPNTGSRQITFKWIDHEIYFLTPDGNHIYEGNIDLGDITDEIEIDPIEKFVLTWRWSCETINITLLSCQNASQSISWEFPNYTITITPEDNIDSGWWCDISFTDWDTTIPWHITFNVKTKDYYVVLDSGLEYSQWHIKNTWDFDTWKISLIASNWDTDLSGKYSIESIKRDDYSQNNWPDYTNISIKIKNFNWTGLDDESCLSWNIILHLDTWFITDPAGNPSEMTDIITNQKYQLWPHICASWSDAYSHILNWNYNTFEYTKSTLENSGFDLTLYSTIQLSWWTTSIECIETNSCPWFHCNGSWIIDGTQLNPSITCTNDEPVDWFTRKYTLRIDPIDSGAFFEADWSKRWNWTGCTIKLKWKCDKSETHINIHIHMSPYKFWLNNSEDFYDYSIWRAIEQWSWDNWFFFYISNPQIIWGKWQAWLRSWVLWKIYYDMTFNDNVADEYYTIQWTGIVNWYQESLEIKRPTYNYANPRSYLFNFPYYDINEQN